MLPIDHILHHEIQNNPLETLEILEKMDFQLKLCDEYENLVRKNKFSHVQKACHDSEGMELPSTRVAMPQLLGKYPND